MDRSVEAAFETIRNNIKTHHKVFWKNCKQQQKKTAKICQDCPFRFLGLVPKVEKEIE